MTVPPHLPAPACNVSNHRQWQNIKILLLAVFFGLFAGLTGAAILLGWVWPSGGSVQNLIGASSGNLLSRETLSDNVRAESEDRLGAVYREISTSANLSYLNPDKKIGEAAFISSDGWMALYYPHYDGAYKNWKVVLKNGSVLNVVRAVRDRYSNLIFIKVNPNNPGQQFKVANFSDSLKVSQDLYAYGASAWHHGIVENYLSQASDWPHLDTAPTIVYEVNTKLAPGSWVVDNDGRFVGVVNDNGQVMVSRYIVAILPGILGAQKLAYHTLGLEGWYSAERPIVINGELVNGFAVSKNIFGNTLLKSGDIILQVSGQLANAENLWYNIVNNRSLNLKIWRRGKVIDIVASVKEI
jgi:hypothetical protein